MKAVIIAGGIGSRLAPYTNVLPKPLMPLGERPILEIIIEQLRDHGFTDITLAVGYLAHLLQAYFGDGSRYGVNISYSVEDKPLGTAGPLTLIDSLDEPFLVMNSDVLTRLAYDDLFQYHCNKDAAVTVSLYRQKTRIDLGVVEISQDAEVLGYVEKPTYQHLVSMGIYVLSPYVLQFFPRGRRFDFPELIHLLLGRGEKIVAHTYEGEWLDIGRPDDYARAIERYEKWDTLWEIEEPPVVVTQNQIQVKTIPAVAGSNGRVK